MPAERVPMRDVRKIIRLKFSARVATREIARRLGMAPSTVRETLKRLAGAGLRGRCRRALAIPAALRAARTTLLIPRLR